VGACVPDLRQSRLVLVLHLLSVIWLFAYPRWRRPWWHAGDDGGQLIENRIRDGVIGHVQAFGQQSRCNLRRRSQLASAMAPDPAVAGAMHCDRTLVGTEVQSDKR
jgi:hypothetical protein